jgi:hypothetical protein
MLAHTALVALAHRYAPDAVLPVGVPMSLRDLDGVGFDTMGLYINVLPAVVRVPEGGTVGSLVAAVRSRLIELQAYKFLPLWRTVELSGLRRSDLIHRNTSMFGVTLAVHSRGSGGEAGGALTSQAPPVPGMHLDIALGEAGGTARLAWRQDSPPLRDPDVLLADYLALFRHMAGDPSAAIASLPLPSDRAAVGDLADPVVVLDAVLGAFQQVTEEVPDAARSFFDSGGNSMTVARLVAVLRRKAMRVKVRDVFEHPVPSDLAAVVARRHGAEGAG